MLEGALERLLLQFLDPYVEGISRDKLHLGVLSGSLELKDLRVREDGLARMGLEGFRVRNGHIKLITLTVPWGRLYTGKVRAVMQGVYMEIEQIASDVDEGTIDKIVQELRHGKKGAIDLRVNQLRELVNEQERASEGDIAGEKKSYGVRLFRKILNNINVDLTDVKVYFMNHRRGLACGAELTDLSVVSTDDQFRPPKSGEEVVVTGLSMYKQIRLHGLGIRMAPAGESELDSAEYILSPISATLQLSHVPSQQKLKIKLEVATEELAEISLRRSQVKHLRGVQDLGKAQQQRIFDYMVPPESMQKICLDPAAAKTEYGNLYERNYERKLLNELEPSGSSATPSAADGVAPLTEVELQKMQVLEDALSVRLLARQRWLVQQRVIARGEDMARREREQRTKALEQERAASSANAGFFGRLFGRGTQARTSESSDSGSIASPKDEDDWLKPEERDQLLEDIDDESKVEAVDMPQRLEFEFELGRVALDLVDDRWSDEVHRQLMSIALTEANWMVVVELKTDHNGQDSAEWSVEVSLRDFQAVHCTKDMFRFAMPGATEADDGEMFWDPGSSGCGPAAKLILQNTLMEQKNLLKINFNFQPLIMHWLPGTLEHLLEFQRTPGRQEVPVKVSDRQVTLEETIEFAEIHKERVKEIAQKVYERIPDQLHLDISIASPVIHVPVPALGEIMLDLGKLEIVTPDPCEYSKIGLAFNFNNTKLRATSLMKECYDVVRPVPINLQVNYNGGDTSNTVNVRLLVDEITFNLAPQALRMLLSMPWAVYDIMKAKEEPKGTEEVQALPPATAEQIIAKHTGAAAPAAGGAADPQKGSADWTRGYEVVSGLMESKTLEKVKEKMVQTRSKQFHLNMVMEWKALDITLSDSTIPVMRLRTELLQPGLQLTYQSMPHLMTLAIERGTLEIEHLNPRNGAWEPLAERFQLGLNIVRNHVGEDGRCMRVSLCAPEAVNINLAPTAMRRAGWIFPLFFQNLTFAAPEEEPSSVYQKRDDSVKYRCINLTDNVIELVFSSEYKKDLLTKIPPTGSEWLSLDDYILPHFVESLVARLPHSADESGTLSLEKLGVVSIPGSGAVAELLAPSPAHRLLLLASPLRVHNHTDLNLLIRFHDGSAHEVLPVDLPPQTACDAALLGFSVPEYIVQSQYGEQDSCQRLAKVPDHCLLLAPNSLCAVPAPALVRQGGTGVNYSHTYLSARPASLEVEFSAATQAGHSDGGIIEACVLKCAHKPQGEGDFFAHSDIHLVCESRMMGANMPASMGLTTIVLQPTLAFMNALPIGNLTVSYGTRYDSAATSNSAKRAHFRGKETRVPSFSCLNIYNHPGVLKQGLRLAARLADGAQAEFSRWLEFGASAFQENDTEQLLLSQKRGEAAAGVNVEALVGYKVRFSCPTWFIDRSGIERPLTLSVKGSGGLLPSSQGITLLPADASDESCQFCLMRDGRQVATQAVRMPPNFNIFSWRAERTDYVFCLQADDIAAVDVMGTDCQVITLRPRLVVTNSSDSVIELKRQDNTLVELAPKSSSALHWSVRSGDEESPSTEIQFRPKTAPPCKWSTIMCGDSTAGSTPFLVAQEAEKGARSQIRPIQVWSVEIAPKRGALAVSIHRGSDCVAVNRATKANVTMEILPQQSEQGIANIPVPQGEEVVFGWSNPYGLKGRRAVDVLINGKKAVAVEDVRCRGNKRLSIKKDDKKKDKDDAKDVIINVYRSGHKTFLAVEDVELGGVTNRYHAGGSQLEFEIKLEKLGLSLISEMPKPKEIMYLTLCLLRLEWVRSPGDLQSLELLISEAQIDCQLPGRIDAQSVDVVKDKSQHTLPVVILANRADGAKSFLSLSLQRGATSSSDLIFPKVQIALDALDVSIDEGWIDPLRSFFRELSGPTSNRGGVAFSDIRRMAGKPIIVEYTAPPLPSIVQVDDLEISQVELTVWCALRLKSAQFLPAYVRTAIGVMSFSGDFTLDGASLMLNQRSLQKHRGSLSDLSRCLASEYIKNLLYYTGTVLGKSSVLNLPRVPLKMGGAAASYAADNFGMIAGEMASFVSKLTFDDQYVQKQKEIREAKNIQSIGDGMVEAGRSLGQGIEGIADLWRKPMEGARQDGVGGFFVGMGKGLVGGVAKPISKFGSAMSDMGSGLAAQVTPESMSNKRQKARTRQRLPRLLFSHLGVVRPWSAFEAELQKELGPASVVGLEEVVALSLTLPKDGKGGILCQVLLFYPSFVDVSRVRLTEDAAFALAEGTQQMLGDRRRLKLSSSSSVGGSSSSTAPAAIADGSSFFTAVEESSQKVLAHAMKPVQELGQSWVDTTLGVGSQSLSSRAPAAKERGYQLKKLRKVRLKEEEKIVVLIEHKARPKGVPESDKSLGLNMEYGTTLDFNNVPGGMAKETVLAIERGFKSALAHPDNIANWDALQAALRAERRSKSDLCRKQSNRGAVDTKDSGNSLGPRSANSASQGTQEVFEVERRMLPAGGWKTPFLPLDTESSWRWIDSAGYRHPDLARGLTQKAAAAEKVPPLDLNKLFNKPSKWQVEKTESTDGEGWVYSIAWNSSTWDAKPGIFDAVRKRRWYRTYE